MGGLALLAEDQKKEKKEKKERGVEKYAFVYASVFSERPKKPHSLPLVPTETRSYTNISGESRRKRRLERTLHDEALVS